VLLLAIISSPGCSNMALPKADMPTSGPDPTYVTLVSTTLKDNFKKLSPTDAVEISQPRWVHTVTGWSWLVCVHFQDQGHRRAYAYFINGSQIVDSRFAVQTDACDAQTYSSLDMASGTMKPTTTGEPGPLY
jgi:hypothetical protein